MLVFKKRIFEKIIVEICKKHDYHYQSFCSGWIWHITHRTKSIYLWGYNFPINNVSSSKLCDDKAALTQILTENKIPCFLHDYFTRDNFAIADLMSCFHKYHNDVVVKPNFGTTGIDVYHCSNVKDFTKYCYKIINAHGALAISPFYDYQNEFRIIAYKQKPYIIYNKTRTNDNWKHNLALGNAFTIINNTHKYANIINLAIKAMKLINIDFCSVDIAIVNSIPTIVEINSGVMLEAFTKSSRSNYNKALSLYEQAIVDLL